MSYFGKTIRNTILDSEEIELMVLKLLCARFLEYEICLSYREKIFLYRTDKEILLHRQGDNEATVSLKHKLTGKATDVFFSTFLNEESVSLDNVTFHAIDISHPGVSWGFLKKQLSVNILTLLKDSQTQEKTIKKFIAPYLSYESTYRAATRSDSSPSN